MMSKREKVKLLIELSSTVEDADMVINENFGFESIQEKIAFLIGMFGVESFDKPDKDTYFSMLSAIISEKYL